jgi:hypothetical protein
VRATDTPSWTAGSFQALQSAAREVAAPPDDPWDSGEALGRKCGNREDDRLLVDQDQRAVALDRGHRRAGRDREADGARERPLHLFHTFHPRQTFEVAAHPGELGVAEDRECAAGGDGAARLGEPLGRKPLGRRQQFRAGAIDAEHRELVPGAVHQPDDHRRADRQQCDERRRREGELELLRRRGRRGERAGCSGVAPRDWGSLHDGSFDGMAGSGSRRFIGIAVRWGSR